SLHVLFVDEADAQALEQVGCMIRHGVQFHWSQDPTQPAADFTELLQRLHRDKRKKIQQEQRRVREAGVHFSVHVGAEIDEPLWDLFYACYCQTYREHHSTPYLSRDFFARQQRDMPENWVLFVAHQGGRAIACSLVAVDPLTRHAYGRYWGALAHVPCLHFDACYYQPLQWCLQQGYGRFEGGAQGEHKMARGLMPVATRSAHWLADPRFAHAVDDFLKREGAHVGAYLDELREHSPFKA
ncbi:MAG: GNAT family N-acetyltransferase, partial [Betaproteobacteria bacterium]